jgi:glycosyltransferase involved in cell wall biosynthesis
MATIHEKLLNELEELRGESLKFIDPERIPCQEMSDTSMRTTIPLVSIAMITYNHEPFIRKALDSIVSQQTNFPFELVIGEDCSLDNTRSILLEYQIQYPRLIRILIFDKNVGAIKNLTCVEFHCRGKYIAYCEGDDFWTSPNKLQKQVSIFDQNEKVGLVYCEGNVFDGEGKCIQTKYVKNTTVKGYAPGLKTKGCMPKPNFPILTCSTMLKKEIIMEAYKKNVLFSIIFSLGDTLRWLESLRNQDAYFCEECMVGYTKHASSTMNGLSFLKVLRDSYIIRWYFLKKFQFDAGDELLLEQGVFDYRIQVINFSKQNLMIRISAFITISKYYFKRRKAFKNYVSLFMHLFYMRSISNRIVKIKGLLKR